MKKQFFFRPFDLFLLATFIVLSCSRCKHDDGPECADKSAIAADFVIEERLGNLWIETEVISSHSQFVRFRALHDNLTYQWQINNNLNTSSSQTYGLGYFPVGSNYTVNLDVAGTPVTECFPDDDGIDSQEKIFSSVDFEDYPILGTYKGTTSLAPTDTFLMTISIELDIVEPLYGDVSYIHNFPAGMFDSTMLQYPYPSGISHWNESVPLLPTALGSSEPVLAVYYDNDSHESIEYSGYLLLEGNVISGDWVKRQSLYNQDTNSWNTTNQNFTYHGTKID